MFSSCRTRVLDRLQPGRVLPDVPVAHEKRGRRRGAANDGRFADQGGAAGFAGHGAAEAGRGGQPAADGAAQRF